MAFYLCYPWIPVLPQILDMHIWFKNQFTENKQITYLYLEHEVNRMREEKLSFLVLYFVLSGIIIVHLDTFFFFFFWLSPWHCGSSQARPGIEPKATVLTTLGHQGPTLVTLFTRITVIRNHWSPTSLQLSENEHCSPPK